MSQTRINSKTKNSIIKILEDTKILTNGLYRLNDLSSIQTTASMLEQKIDELGELIMSLADNPEDLKTDLPDRDDGRSVKDLLDDIHRQYLLKTSDKSIEFNLNISPTLPDKLIGEFEILREVMTGLLEDSMKFGDNGRINLTCLYNSGQLILSVSTPSSETVNTLDQNNPVLSRLKAKVDSVNGSLSVNCEERLGCIFSLTLPFSIKTTEESTAASEMVTIEEWFDRYRDNEELSKILFRGLAGLRNEVMELQQAVLSKDRLRISKLLHAMKAFPGGFGLKPVYNLLVQMERQLQQPTQDFTAIKEGITEITRYLLSVPEKYFDDTGLLPGKSSQQPPAREQINSTRVLVAEDHPMSQEIVQYVLDKMNYTYEFVDNGFDVIKELNARHYDLLLLDIQLPGMDGIETVKKIRTDSRFDDLPVIAVTANALMENRNEYISAGCNDYIPKPVVFKTMMKKINQALS